MRGGPTHSVSALLLVRSWSPHVSQDADDLDKLYSEMEALTGEGDEWFDDDFGLGGIKPSYNSSSGSGSTASSKPEQQPGQC